MRRHVKAVFERGVFRPVRPIKLAEGTQVEVLLDSDPKEDPKKTRDPREVARLIAEIAAMPLEGPSDGFSGRDHDKILYGYDAHFPKNKP